MQGKKNAAARLQKHGRHPSAMQDKRTALVTFEKEHNVMTVSRNQPSDAGNHRKYHQRKKGRTIQRARYVSVHTQSFQSG